MSAYLLPLSHLHALVRAALATQPHDPQLRWGSGRRVTTAPDDIRATVHALAFEIEESVAYRYPGDARPNLPGPIPYLTPDELADAPFSHEGVLDRRHRDAAPLEWAAFVAKALDCYEHQACEHPGWEASPARAFCRTLRKALTQALPGYDGAPWGIESDARPATREG